MGKNYGKEEYGNIKEFMYVLVCTIGWGFLIHGYGFFNMIYSMDSMLVYQNDDAFQFGLGRFMVPFYARLRGRYYPPSVIGVLALTYIAVSTYLIIRMFRISDKFLILFICAIMSTNKVVIFLVADFICFMDVQLLSLMLMVIGVYLVRNYKWGLIAFIPLCVVSLGLYQAYFQVGVTLFLSLAIYDLAHNRKAGEVIKNFILQMIAMLAGIVLYMFTMKLVNRYMGMNTSNGANAVGAAFRRRSMNDVVKLATGMYLDFCKNIIDQGGNYKYVKGIAITIILITAFVLFMRYLKSREISKMNIVLILAAFVILPAGMTCVYIGSNGYYHDLMRYSHYIVYSLALAVIYKCSDKKNLERMVYALLVFFIIDNMVGAGNQYLHKDMIYQTTMFNMTRIIDRLEQTEGYEPGKPVIFAGDIEISSMNYVRDDYFRMSGTHFYSSVTYYRLYERYFQKLLGYPIWILPREDAVEMEKNPEVDKMPVFPAKDSIKEIDGVFVIKVSDVKLEIFGQPRVLD